MVNCIIGPLTFTGGFYVEDNNEYGVMEGVESFSIVGETWKIRQLRGLVTPGSSETSMGITIRGSQQKSWGPVWIDASQVSSNGDENTRLTHKGWYLIRKVEFEHVNVNNSKAILEVELIDNVYDVFLEMDSTDSNAVGSQIKTTYNLTEDLILLEDDFNGTSLDPSKWIATTWNMTGGSHTVSGGKLQMSGIRTAIIPGMPVWGARSIQSKQSFDAPFYAEFDLELVDLSSGSGEPYLGHNHHFVMRPGQWLDREGWPDTFLIINDTGNGTRDKRFVKPYTDPLVFQYVSSDTKLHKWKILVETNGLVTAWTWNSTTSEWDFFWKGPCGLSRMWGLTIGFTHHSHESINHTVYTDKIKVYRTQEQALESIMKVPNVERTTASGTVRGSSVLVSDPTGSYPFQLDEDDPLSIYEGSPKIYSSFNPSNELRQIFSPVETLKPNKCKFENDIFQIIPNTSSITINHKLSGSWSLLNEFGFGENISYIKILNYTPEELLVQINRTKWCLRRSEPFVYVKHPNTAFSMTSTTYYDCDSGVISGGVGIDIPMVEQYYALGYGSSDYGELILKTNPTTIKSDLIPQSELTGIGVYNRTESSASYNHYSKLAKEWLNPVDQRIRIIR